MSQPIVSVKNAVKTFVANKGLGGKKFVHAVNDVSFDIMPGETFSLVGERQVHHRAAHQPPDRP